MRKVWSLIVVLFCMTSANALAFNLAPDARKLDEFGNINCEDEMARLDNFATELQNNPDARGYIIFYGGKRNESPSHSFSPALPRRGEGEARAARLMPYLSERRGIERNRVVVINGGYREHWSAELWIVPAGANAPNSTPTVKAREIKFRRGVIKKSEYQCGL